MADGPQPVGETLSWITERGYYAGQIAHYRVLEGQPASRSDLRLTAPVAGALQAQGIASLYTDQATAIDAVRDHENAVVATPTASGKTLSYVILALERAVDHQGETLYIAPYRALIDDQEETFREYGDSLGFGESVSVGVQTGDTSKKRREEIKRSQPDIPLITLDQLHTSLLKYAHSPRHWKWLFQQLETVAIDEVHMYRGATDDNAQWETDIRDIDNRQVDLVDRNRDERLASLEYTAALRDAHPNSIYVHQKEKYRVEELDLDEDVAWMESTSTNEVTKAIREKEFTLQDTMATRQLALDGASVHATLSEMTVKEVVTGYLHFDYPDDDNPIEKTFDKSLPPSELETVGFHFPMPSGVEQRMLARVEDEEEYLGALHAVEHTLISLLPMEVLCDRRDIGGLSILDHSQRLC